MPMTINKYFNWSTFQSFKNELFCVENFWMLHWARICPLSVQVISWKRCSIVTYNHSIRVQHRDYFKDVLFSKKSCIFVIRNKESNHSLYNITWLWFSWMNSTCDKNAFSICQFVLSWLKICYKNQINVIFRKRFTKKRNSNSIRMQSLYLIHH